MTRAFLLVLSYQCVIQILSSSFFELDHQTESGGPNKQKTEGLNLTTSPKNKKVLYVLYCIYYNLLSKNLNFCQPHSTNHENVISIRYYRTCIITAYFILLLMGFVIPSRYYTTLFFGLMVFFGLMELNIRLSGFDLLDLSSFSRLVKMTESR